MTILLSIIIAHLMGYSLVQSALSIIIMIIWCRLGCLDIVRLRHVFQFLMKFIVVALGRRSSAELIKSRLIHLVNILNIFLLPSLLVQCDPLKIGHVVV